MCFPNILVKKKWISEFHRTNPQELKCWSTFYVNCFLRYYLMMQHQPIVKRVNGTHEWARRPYQLLIIADCTSTGGQMKGSHPRTADRCLFVLRHSISQVTSFMQLGMLWLESPTISCQDVIHFHYCILKLVAYFVSFYELLMWFREHAQELLYGQHMLKSDNEEQV